VTQLAAHTDRVLGPSDAVPDDLVVPCYLNDRKLRISIARVGGRLYAFDDLCTCAEPPWPLSGGLLTGTALMCQCHGSRFDIATGAVINGPRPSRCTFTRCGMSTAAFASELSRSCVHHPTTGAPRVLYGRAGASPHSTSGCSADPGADRRRARRRLRRG